MFKVTAAFVGLVTFQSLSRKSSQSIFIQIKATKDNFATYQTDFNDEYNLTISSELSPQSLE